MTTVISLFGILGRFAGDLLMSALGWASSLLFGRVPRSHQIFLVLMMAFSFLWLLFGLGLIVPSVIFLLLSATPHPPFVDRVPLGAALIVGLIVIPLIVGVAGYLVPSKDARAGGTEVFREALRGYLLVPVIIGLLVFLAGVGLVRKVRSARHRWSDAHVPIVVKPGGYDQLVEDLRQALAAVDLPVTARDAPRVLSVPAWVLSRVAGPHVRHLRPDHLVELQAPDLRIGLYPSDIAISGSDHTRIRARAAIVSRLATSSSHLTTTAEAQGFEDRLLRLSNRWTGAAGGNRAGVSAALSAIDGSLLDLEVPPDEWDVLYRIRLQIERDLLQERSEPAGS